MLYFDSALELEGVTVFRDFNTPNKFYYMPRAPRLTTEGGPMFQLLIYRRDITDNPDFRAGDRPGGGFLTMTVDIGVPLATLNAVKTQLASRVSGGGDIDLVAVPFENGSVRISALGTSAGRAPGLEGAEAEGGTAVAERGPRFVERIIGSARPSMYNDNRAVFTIELSHEGAQLMRASLEDGGATQIAVVYELDYRGLMPAYEASITINFKQSYEYLRNRFTMNTLWFKADIDSEVEKLKKDGSIVIKDVDYLGGDAAAAAERATRLLTLAKELATWSFFRPGLTPGTVLANDRGSLTVYDPTTAATQNTAGFTAPLVAAGTGRGSPGDVAGPRTQGDSANPSTTRVGGDAVPAVGAGGAAAAPAEQAAGGSGNAVEAWNRMGRPQAGYLMRQLSQEEQQTITYNLQQISATKRTAAPQGSIRMLPGAAALAGRIKVVDLNDPFFEKVAGAVTTNSDLTEAGVTSMVVNLRYGVRDDGTAPKDTKEVVLRQKGDSTPYEFFMDKRRAVTLDYDVVVNYKAGYAIGSEQVQATWKPDPTTTRNLEIDPRNAGAAFPVTLVLGNVQWDTTLQTVQSTISYDDDPSNTHDERTVVFSSTETTKIVPILPPKGGTKKFKVRSTFFRPGGIEEVSEVHGEGVGTVVVNPPAGRAIPVSVILADPLGRFRSVTVETSYAPGGGQPEQNTLHELTEAAPSAPWRFVRPSDTAEPKYRYKVTEFGKDGTTRTVEWQDTKERQLIVGDRFEQLAEIQVSFFIESIGALGFMAAKLVIDYPDAPPQVKRKFEKLFQGPAKPEPFTWKVPRKPGGTGMYSYTVQWVRGDGTSVTTGPVTQDGETVMIFPPVVG